MGASITSTSASVGTGTHVPLAGIASPSKDASQATGSNPDPMLVQEMKNEIRTLVQEIAQLAQTEISTADFYGGFLTRVVSAMAAVGGAVWTSGENGLKLEYQVNLADANLDDSTDARRNHGLLLRKVITTGSSLLLPPRAGGPGDDAGANPSDQLLVLVPLKLEQESVGVIEVFQRPGNGPATQRGYIRFLSQMADLAGDYLKNQRLRFFSDKQQLWRQLEQFIEAIHHSLDLRQTSYAIVNEGRRLIGCDRVSLAIRSGGRCRVTTVSGLDTIDRRATEVRELSALATAVLLTAEPLWHCADSDEAPPQIEEPLQAYLDAAHARLVAVLPLFAPTGITSAAEGAEPTRGRLLGALIVEQLQDNRATEQIRSRAQTVAQHSAAALANASAYSHLFLLPLWRALGHAFSIFRGRALPKTLAVLLLLGGAITALALIPTDFEIAAHGKLQPAERRDVFARMDGDVVEVPVRHGQMVAAGDVLAQLNSAELSEELERLLGRQKTNLEQMSSTNKRLLDSHRGGAARLTPDEENRLAGELIQFRQEAENIRRELELFQEKQRRLTVVADQPGQVVTWKVEETLLRRPVLWGQVLMTLANPEGPWELELYLPERRLQHLLAATELPEGGSRPPLDVTFMLSSHPGTEFHGRVVELEQTAEVRGEDGNTIMLRVEVDRDTLPHLHDQTTVTARLYCGQRSLGYTWFCDLIETVQSKVLFWL